MKMLVCIDGSEQSQKALEKSLIFAQGPAVSEVGIIHVYDGKMDLSASAWGGRDYSVTEEDLKRLRQMHEEQQEVRKNILDKALNLFEEKNIKAITILEDGHPSHVIVDVAAEKGYDIIVIGSRGLGGLKKLFLGSVSNSVAQEAKNCCVVIVK